MPEIIFINLCKILLCYDLHFHLHFHLEGMNLVFLYYFKVLFWKVLTPERLPCLRHYQYSLASPSVSFFNSSLFLSPSSRSRLSLTFNFGTHIYSYMCIYVFNMQKFSVTVLCVVLSFFFFFKESYSSFSSNFMVQLTVPLDNMGKRDQMLFFMVQRHSVT